MMQNICMLNQDAKEGLLISGKISARLSRGICT